MRAARRSPRARHVVAALATLAAASVMLASCRQLVGLDASGGSLPVCGLALLPEACDACMTGACCEAMMACAADAECAALLGCVGPCAGDDACRSRCRAAHLPGLARLGFEVLACQATSCAAPCGVACGGYLYPSAACAACGAASCCDAAAACAGAADCLSLAACERACLTAADYHMCVGDCIQGFPAGADAARALGQCLGDACAPTCGDPAWTCLDTVTWPAASKAPVTIWLQMNDYLTGAPVSGASVKLCRVTDEPCDAPIAGPLTTGADGLATFPGIVPSPAGAGFYFEVTGASLFPALYFLDPEPIAADVTFAWSFVSAAAAMGLNRGVPLDPSRGQIVLSIHGCFDPSAAGATLVGEGPGFDSFSVPIYLRNGLPVTGVTTTDQTGIAGFLNVKPGNVTLKAEVASTQQLVGSAVVFVRAGYVTYTVLPPTPR
jgi:hypothetical protein